MTSLASSAAALGGVKGADNEIIVRRIRVPVGGDVILAIQGKEIDSVQQLQTEIDRYKPGDAHQIHCFEKQQEDGSARDPRKRRAAQ